MNTFNTGFVEVKARTNLPFPVRKLPEPLGLKVPAEQSRLWLRAWRTLEPMTCLRGSGEMALTCRLLTVPSNAYPVRVTLATSLKAITVEVFFWRCFVFQTPALYTAFVLFIVGKVLWAYLCNCQIVYDPTRQMMRCARRWLFCQHCRVLRKEPLFLQKV